MITMKITEPDFDVIIVGAGPSGATTAKCLLNRRPDLRVLLLEKAFQIPRPKPCGGYLAADLFEKFPYLQKMKAYFVESESYEGILHSPDLRYQVSGRTRMLGVQRDIFDAFLVGLAQQAGAQIGTQSKVIDVKPQQNQVRILLQDGRTLTTRTVVGADGAVSTVARRTGLHAGWQPHQICKTIVKEVAVEPDFILNQFGPDRSVHLFLQFNQIPGYAWVFPKAHSINFGLGCFANASIRLIDYFHLLVKLLQKKTMLPPAISLKGIEAGLCPTVGPLKITQADRVLLVGDAAGFVSPLTGAGIIWGMVSGQLAAETINEAFTHQRYDAKFLTRYQQRWERDIGRFRNELFIQRAFLTRWCNIFIRIGERDAGIREFLAQAQGQNLTTRYARNVNVFELLLRLFWALIKGPIGLL
jgi:digeranylgeranylglycerophospholipid reductase